MRLSLYCKSQAIVPFSPTEKEWEAAARIAIEKSYQDVYRKAFQVEAQLVLEAVHKPLTADDVRRILDGAA